MFTFETSDPKEARRFRIAQFNGRTATARAAGSTVTGHVRSIVENKSRVPAARKISIEPLERDDFSPNRHPALSCLSMISAQALRICREGKPASTLPDHALARGCATSG
jgi:hypothetical protein